MSNKVQAVNLVYDMSGRDGLSGAEGSNGNMESRGQSGTNGEDGENASNFSFHCKTITSLSCRCPLCDPETVTHFT
jgi:hypothetical protein